MIPASPLTKVIGRNTARVVSEEATTAIATSLVAYTAACLGLLPLSIWVVMFSSTTIAASTTIPIAMERELIEIIFKVLPVAKR